MTECWASSIAKNVEVSNFGRLRNALTHEIIEPTFTYRGHAVAYPCYKKWLVHRLVAIAFIANLNNLPEVNHKDCNQKNAAADNLEWCMHKQNEAYKYQGPNAEQNKESQRKRAIGNKGPIGQHWTLDAKVCEARSKRMKGVYNSNNRAGTHHSEETKRKMSEARKRYYENKKNVKT